MTDSTLQRARQRALASTQPRPKQNAESGLRNASSVTTEQRFVEVPARGKTYRVPDPQFYAMSPSDRERFFDEVDNKRDQERGRTEFDQTALFLTDQLSDERKRRKALEGQVAALQALVEGMQRQLESQDASLELQRSDALTQQQVEIAQQTVNLQAIGAEQEANHQRRMAEEEKAATDHRDRLAITERLVGDHEARLQSSGVLFQERAGAVEVGVADAERRIAKAEVDQENLDNGISANRKTLSAVTGINLESEINASVKSAFEAQLEPEMAALVERKYVLLAPTTTSGEQPRDDSTPPIAKPFLTEQVVDNATAKAVEAALKRSKSKRSRR